MEPLDPHSFTDSHHPLTTDISLFLFLDFPSATIYAIAFFILKSPYVGQLSFDTRSLSIHQVLSPITLSPLPFSLSSSADPIKGTQLSISLPDDDVLNSFFIVFSTSPSSSALQWLSPLQMFNKKTPFCLYPMPVYPRAFHFPMSRHSRGENPLLCFAQCPSKVSHCFKDKMRSSKKNQASSSSRGGGGEGNQDGITDEEALSNITKRKAAAAKQYIENHYKEQMKNLQDRKERYKDEPSIMKYIKIAATLPDKIVRDVALRCWWMQAHA